MTDNQFLVTSLWLMVAMGIIAFEGSVIISSLCILNAVGVFAITWWMHR